LTSRGAERKEGGKSAVRERVRKTRLLTHGKRSDLFVERTSFKKKALAAQHAKKKRKKKRKTEAKHQEEKKNFCFDYFYFHVKK
jgi:hypothetical protein